MCERASAFRARVQLASSDKSQVRAGVERSGELRRVLDGGSLPLFRTYLRETGLTELIYSRHPRFAGTPRMHGAHLEHVEGGDVLLLAPGVIAVGVGERTTPAGAERLARRCFTDGLAHTVLAVPIAQERATMHPRHGVQLAKALLRAELFARLAGRLNGSTEAWWPLGERTAHRGRGCRWWAFRAR